MKKSIIMLTAIAVALSGCQAIGGKKANNTTKAYTAQNLSKDLPGKWVECKDVQGSTQKEIFTTQISINGNTITAVPVTKATADDCEGKNLSVVEQVSAEELAQAAASKDFQYTLKGQNKKAEGVLASFDLTDSKGEDALLQIKNANEISLGEHMLNKVPEQSQEGTKK